MVAFLAVVLRDGDILQMYRLYSSRHSAFAFIESLSSASNRPNMWWKVLPIHSGDIVPGRTYEIVLSLQSKETKQIAVVGVYDPGMIPDNVRANMSFYAETLTCE